MEVFHWGDLMNLFWTTLNLQRCSLHKPLLPILLKVSMIYSVLEIPLPTSDLIHSNVLNVTGIHIPSSLHWFPRIFLIFSPLMKMLSHSVGNYKCWRLLNFSMQYLLRYFLGLGPKFFHWLLWSMIPLLIMPQRQRNDLSDIYRFFLLFSFPVVPINGMATTLLLHQTSVRRGKYHLPEISNY